jgi:hypothetical protein
MADPAVKRFELREEAARLHNNRKSAYLLGKPMFADHLEEGLSQFGLSCEDFLT